MIPDPLGNPPVLTGTALQIGPIQSSVVLQESSPWQAAVSSGGHITVVWANGLNVYNAMTENTTVDNPVIAPADGSMCVFLFLNTASNRTAAWGNKFLFVATTPPTITVGVHYSFVTFVYKSVVGQYLEFSRNLNVG